MRKGGQGFEKLGGSYAKCVGRRNDVYDRDIPFAALDSTHIVSPWRFAASRHFPSMCARSIRFGRRLSERAFRIVGYCGINGANRLLWDYFRLAGHSGHNPIMSPIWGVGAQSMSQFEIQFLRTPIQDFADVFRRTGDLSRIQPRLHELLG